MKSSVKTANFLLVLFAIILGIVIVVNLFLPGTFPQFEGFQEGNTARPTVQQQTCDKKTCNKSFSNIDKWFEGKSVDDLKAFFNSSTGTLLPKPTYPFSIDKKDNCSNYIQCKAIELVKSSGPSSDSTTTTTSSDTSSEEKAKSGAERAAARDALLQAQQAITTAMGKV